MAQPRTLLSIQYLRGLAALAVVAFHTSWTRTPLGQAGVDLFFVISGFVMMHVSARETTPLAFLRARAWRLVPLYWLATLATVAVIGMPPAWHLAQSLAFWPHPDPGGHNWPVAIQGWTLCFEAFFYVVFAGSLLLPRAYRLVALTGVLVALCTAGLILRPVPETTLGAYTDPLLLEFAAGCWLHATWQRGLLDRAPILLLGAGLAAMAVQIRYPMDVSLRAVVYGIPMLLIAAGALGLEGAGRLPCVPGLRQLGDSSYALYLSHILVLKALRPLATPLPAPVAVLVVCAACVAVGWLVHIGVERPIQRLARRQVHSSAPAVAAAG